MCLARRSARTAGPTRLQTSPSMILAIEISFPHPAPFSEKPCRRTVEKRAFCLVAGQLYATILFAANRPVIRQTGGNCCGENRRERENGATRSPLPAGRRTAPSGEPERRAALPAGSAIRRPPAGTAGGNGERDGLSVAKRTRLRPEEIESAREGRPSGGLFLFFGKTPLKKCRFPIPGAAETDLRRVL